MPNPVVVIGFSLTNEFHYALNIVVVGAGKLIILLYTHTDEKLKSISAIVIIRQSLITTYSSIIVLH